MIESNNMKLSFTNFNNDNNNKNKMTHLTACQRVTFHLRFLTVILTALTVLTLKPDPYRRLTQVSVL